MNNSPPLDSTDAGADADDAAASIPTFPGSHGHVEPSASGVKAATATTASTSLQVSEWDASSIAPADGYAGDVSVQTAWRWMQEGTALLVDVRTDAEREWVGYVPGAVPLALKQWPGMAMNADFDTELETLGQVGRKLVMLCRSGVRSIAAARRATELGMDAYNIVGGFEGDPDAAGQRNTQSGWRHAGLPWKQN